MGKKLLFSFVCLVSITWEQNLGYIGRVGTAGTNNDQFIGSNASQGSQSERQLQIDTTYWQSVQFESLVGADDREEVLNTNIYPFRTIGQLEFYCNGVQSSCTGTLIGPKTVATSAHCIYFAWSYCENIQFFPGFQAEGGAQKKGVSSSQQHIPEEFKQFPDKPHYDYGVVILDEDIGFEIGWMSFGYSCSQQIQDLHAISYVQNLMYYTQCDKQTINACPCSESELTNDFWTPVNTVFETSGINSTNDPWTPVTVVVGNSTNANEVDSTYDPWRPVIVDVRNTSIANTSSDESCVLQEGYMMKHSCDVTSGQAGSPLWSFIDKPRSPQIRAIHSQGFRSCEKSNDQDCEEKNKAVAIGPEVYDFFLTYI